MTELTGAVPRDDAAPSFVMRVPNADPAEPKVEEKYFHGHKYYGWMGRMPFEEIGTWIDNRRTELLKIKFERDTGALPTNDQLCEMMVDTDETEGDLHIKELADHIAANGLRQRLILSRDKSLLDGNRRYTALWWLRKSRKAPELPSAAKTVPVWVIDADSTETQAVFDVVTDLNFVSDYKEEWGQYVRARVLYEQWDKGNPRNGGQSVTALARQYNWRPSRVGSYVHTAALIDEFLMHHDSAPAALELAYEHFIWFEQLYRSCGKLLDKEYAFKEAVFNWLLPKDGEAPRFQQARDFARLGEIWNNTTAWNTLEAQSGPAGLREALYIVDGERIAKDPVTRLMRLTKDLIGLRDKGDLERVTSEALTDFHAVATEVPGAPANAEARILKMVQWLDELTAKDMKSLSPHSLERLRTALLTVTQMVDVARRAEASSA